MAMITVTLMAYYDFELCNKQGGARTTPVPMTDRNWTSVKPIVGDMFIKLKRRF